MRIGYSFWGFLGEGLVDTPDGGRSHRRIFLDGLQSKGHEVILLQQDRDSIECRESVPGFLWDADFPEIDLLFLEWRWPIPGRNIGVSPGSATYTPDLDRQRRLIERYTEHKSVPTFVWDKDLKRDRSDKLFAKSNVAVVEAALIPSHGAHTLLFPIEDSIVDRGAHTAWRDTDKEYAIVYIGNQYERDDCFDEFFHAAASSNKHLVAGKWPRRTRWRNIDFVDRIAFNEVGALYRSSVSTVLLSPLRYASRGQITQRLTEALSNGCVPIGIDITRSIDDILPRCLIAADGQDVSRICKWLAADKEAAREAHAAAFIGLDRFRLSRQLDALSRYASKFGVAL